MTEKQENTNALARQTSPYLLQHATNPVDWFPWGQEALGMARELDKPILLSIGYSACHWCHVMAHESFEDPDTARLMNEYYVNIKVDREERPDLDKIYQMAHQILTQRPGGWPLTVFLTPEDHAPFFAGTYFPKESRYGMPAFGDLLIHIARVFREQRQEIGHQNTSLVEVLHSLDPQPGNERTVVTPQPMQTACRQLKGNIDPTHGGFGGAPKFPHTTNLELLLREYAATTLHGTPDGAALDGVMLTLRRMALGGIYDQVGGGFCRYSVDDRWMIPHFEKMLYDNGPLLAICSQAWQVTGDALFQRVGLETGAWVMGEMQDPAGGYYASLDADSEGEEGKFYVWTPPEVRAVLSDEEYAVVNKRFGLEGPPNFEGKQWHLHVYQTAGRIAAALGIDAQTTGALLASARMKLYQARCQRVRPGRDGKILTSWNGLMIKGMAMAGHVLGVPRFIDSAERALDFVRNTLWRDGRLLATCKDGRAHLAAYLDDYALLIDGILHLLQARWRSGDLEFAMELADVLLARFEDKERGGFFFTADDHEALLHRTKPLMDESLPAGNGIAAQVLGRLGHLLGETRYLESAERTLRFAWPTVTNAPHAYASVLQAAEEYLNPPQTVILRGTGKALSDWQERCRADYAPRRAVYAVPVDAGPLPGVLAERRPVGDSVAYICEGHHCLAPATDLPALESELKKTAVSRASMAKP